MPGRGHADDAPAQRVPDAADSAVAAALVAAAPSLNPSGGARARMRLRVLTALVLSHDRAGTSARGGRQHRFSVAF